MRVLVTGAGGFLGRHVLPLLQQHGVAVLALGRTRPAALAGADFMAVDLLQITDVDALARGAGATHLLHLAWVTAPGQYGSSPLNFRWVDATVRLVEAFCRSGGRHVVVAGSCAEYDWSAGTCREDLTPLQPASVYGVAKDATRRLVTALCAQHQVRCAWGRVFFPFGVGEAPERLVPSLVQALQGRQPPFGVDPHACRDFLHVSDVAQALWTLLESDAQGCYNISSGHATPVVDVVRILATQLVGDPRTILDLPPARAPGPALVAGENLKLAALGWRPRLSLAQGLEQLVSALPVVAPDQEAGPHGT